MLAQALAQAREAPRSSLFISSQQSCWETQDHELHLEDDQANYFCPRPRQYSGEKGRYRMEKDRRRASSKVLERETARVVLTSSRSERTCPGSSNMIRTHKRTSLRQVEESPTAAMRSLGRLRGPRESSQRNPLKTLRRPCTPASCTAMGQHDGSRVADPTTKTLPASSHLDSSPRRGRHGPRPRSLHAGHAGQGHSKCFRVELGAMQVARKTRTLNLLSASLSDLLTRCQLAWQAPARGRDGLARLW